MSTRIRVFLSASAAAAVTAGVFVATAGSSGSANVAMTRAQLAAALNVHLPATEFKPYETLSDMLPNVRHPWRERPDMPGEPVSYSVVRGRVLSVAKFNAFVESGQSGTAGRPGARATNYDDPTADWRAVRVTVKVEETLAGPRTSELDVFLTMIGHARDGEVGSMEQTLRDLGEIAVITRRNPSSPEYLGLTNKLADTSFGIATVDGAGRLGFPLFDPDPQPGKPTAQEFMAGVDTVAKLRAEAAKAPRRKVNG